MNLYSNEKRLVAAIREAFPAAAMATDQWLLDRAWELDEISDAPWTWIDAFADRITEYAKAKDSKSIMQQTKLISDWYLDGPPEIKSIIDVAYAENILWDANKDEKRWAWQFVADTVRKLNEIMWGPAQERF
jgi:hypothetical protein